MGICFSEPTTVQQRRGAAEARQRAWRATGIVSLPPNSREIPAAVFDELAPVVKVLDATDCSLTQLPAEIGRLTNLTRLVLVSGFWRLVRGGGIGGAESPHVCAGSAHQPCIHGVLLPDASSECMH